MFMISIPKQEYIITGLAMKMPDGSLGRQAFACMDVSDSDILGIKLSSTSNLVHILPPITISKIIESGIRVED